MCASERVYVNVVNCYHDDDDDDDEVINSESIKKNRVYRVRWSKQKHKNSVIARKVYRKRLTTE